MAGGGDKTEKPTPKRLEDARKKGQVAKSQDLNGAIILIAATGIMGFAGYHGYLGLSNLTKETYTTLLQSVAISHPTNTGFVQLINTYTQKMAGIVGPFFLGIAVLAIIGNIAQNKPNVAFEALQPKLEKVNPIQGFKRLWSMRSIVETVKAIIKMTIIGIAGTVIIRSHIDELMSLTLMTPLAIAQIVLGIMAQVAISACIIFLILGLADFFYQKYEHNKQLKMTKQEIKDEHKNTEGDQQIKGKIRQIGFEMSRKQQLKSVKTADVVITNPTHYAVAIQYDPDVSPAPMVVAKGVDHFALKIREVAKENGVLIQENKPLARALYAMVDVMSMIPPELFVAVAEVLAIVFSKKKGRKLKGKNRR